MAHSGGVLVGTRDGRLSNLDPDSGAPRWVQNLGAAVTGRPVDLGSVVAAATERGELFFLDATSGQVRSRVSLQAPCVVPLAAEDDLLAAVTTGGLVLVDAARQAVTARVTLAQATRAPAIQGGRVIVHDLSGLARGFSRTGRSLWTARTPGGASMDPLALDGDDGGILTGSILGGLQTLDPDSGAVRWRALSGTTPVGAASDGDGVLVALLDGRLVRLGRGGAQEKSALLGGLPIAAPGISPRAVVVPLSGGKSEILDPRYIRVGIVNHRGQVVGIPAVSGDAVVLALRERVAFRLRL